MIFKPDSNKKRQNLFFLENFRSEKFFFNLFTVPATPNQKHLEMFLVSKMDLRNTCKICSVELVNGRVAT